MTININLLPKAKRRIKQEPIILLLGLFLLAASSYVLYHQYQSAVAVKEQTANMLAEIRSQKEKLQQQLTSEQQQADTKPDITQYQELPQVIEAASVDTTFLFERLAALLPTGSLVSSLEYQAPDKVKVSVKFATIEEAVSFIKAAQQSPYFAVKSVGSVGESKAEGSFDILADDDKIASNYTLSFELLVKRNKPDGTDPQTAQVQQR
jgi:hypothetical protein